MELYVGVIGIIGLVFVVIFGGRGLIDLVRGEPAFGTFMPELRRFIQTPSPG